MSKPLPAHAEIVIVGGGVVGASIAYHLTRLGKRDVVRLDAWAKRRFGEAAPPGNAQPVGGASGSSGSTMRATSPSVTTRGTTGWTSRPRA